MSCISSSRITNKGNRTREWPNFSPHLHGWLVPMFPAVTSMNHYCNGDALESESSTLLGIPDQFPPKWLTRLQQCVSSKWSASTTIVGSTVPRVWWVWTPAAWISTIFGRDHQFRLTSLGNCPARCGTRYTNKNATMVGSNPHHVPLRYNTSHKHNSKISQDASSNQNSYLTLVNQVSNVTLVFPVSTNVVFPVTLVPHVVHPPQSCTSGVCSVVIPWHRATLPLPLDVRPWAFYTAEMKLLWKHVLPQLKLLPLQYVDMWHVKNGVPREKIE